MTKARLVAWLASTVLGLAVVPACSVTTTASGPRSTPGATIDVPAEPGPGVSDKTITLAHNYLYDGTKTAFGAVVDTYNRTGGIAGRQIRLVPLPTGKAPDNASEAVFDQATCLAVKDYEGGIFAVMGDIGSPALDSCLNKNGTAVTLASGLALPASLFEQAPYTAGLVLGNERAAEALAGQLKSSGFLSGARTVAVVSASGRDDTAAVARDTLAPLLKAQGVRNVPVDVFDGINMSAINASTASVALKLKSQKPDRVVLFGQAPSLGDVMSKAVAQGVDAPVAGFALSTTAEPAALGLEAVSQKQLARSTVVNWNSQFGSKQAVAAANAANPAATSCLKVLEGAGATDAVVLQGLALCEELELLRAALSADGNKAVNAQAFISGINSLTEFGNPMTVFGAGFSPARHDGITATQAMPYDPDCKCFNAKGRPAPIKGDKK